MLAGRRSDSEPRPFNCRRDFHGARGSGRGLALYVHVGICHRAGPSRARSGLQSHCLAPGRATVAVPAVFGAGPQ